MIAIFLNFTRSKLSLTVLVVLAVFGLGAGTFVPVALAQSTTEAARPASTSEINSLIEDLRPGREKKVYRKSVREIVVTDDAGNKKTYKVDYGSSTSLSVTFKHDSDRLTPAARKLLKLLGAALRSKGLAGSSYMIAGHTDASGPRAYNQSLSERRALSVVRYLSDTLQIDRRRLLPVGFGESDLLYAKRPRSAQNRRVVVGLIVGTPEAPAPDETTDVPTDGDTNTLIGD